MHSFHIILATIGRPTLQRMLNSLLPQLTEQDHLTIVYDGKTDIPNFEKKGVCKIHEYCEPNPLGFWGHGVRNKYASLIEKTDFVMHADDDDSYFPDAFLNLRKLCVDVNTLYIAKMKSGKRLIPGGNYIKLDHIGTPCGIVPYELNKLGEWKTRYGGDGLFYEQLAKIAKNIVHLNCVIYAVRE
jgi:hypothetical protein